jgi:hypothetical protein
MRVGRSVGEDGGIAEDTEGVGDLKGEISGHGSEAAGFAAGVAEVEADKREGSVTLTDELDSFANGLLVGGGEAGDGLAKALRAPMHDRAGGAGNDEQGEHEGHEAYASAEPPAGVFRCHEEIY